MNLSSPVAELKNIGPQYATLLKKLGIETIQDFLFYFPRRWDDFSLIIPIAQASLGETITVKGEIKSIHNQTTKKRFVLTEALISDETGTLRTVWFNQPYILNTLKKSTKVILAGKFTLGPKGPYLNSPSYEKLVGGELKHLGRIIPVYPETAGITSRWLRYKIQPLLKFVYSVKDYLPFFIKERQNLLDLSLSIRAIHFPQNQEELNRAKQRLAFDELFFFLLKVLAKKFKQKKEIAHPFKTKQFLMTKFLKGLPFELTGDQKTVLEEILKDLEKDTPMNRILVGDVGSGKTVVATAAILNIVNQNWQVALMCPTEILAKQHLKTIQKLLKKFKVNSEILIGSQSLKKKKEIKEKIKNWQIDFLVGTHALLSEDVSFKKLGLVIIDEQHRFGVEQRTRLKEIGGNNPHFLSLTATPIPRTLTLTVLGDLDVSIIKEMPPKRKKVITKLINTKERVLTYNFIASEIKKGRQMFVVCPLIGQGETLDLDFEDKEEERKEALKEFNKLKRIFPDFKIGLLHGRMNQMEKDEEIEKFLNKQTNILVTTSIIEVGIDIPNATILLIEDPERFGLAQLHQLRGRVGRGKHQSFCFLIFNPKTQDAPRLKAIEKISDGFQLAEIDLKLRGPGEIFGIKQHGIPKFKIASFADLPLIEKAKKEAEDILTRNPELSNFPIFKQYLEKYQLDKD